MFPLVMFQSIILKTIIPLLICAIRIYIVIELFLNESDIEKKFKIIAFLLLTGIHSLSVKLFQYIIMFIITVEILKKSLK